MTLFGYTIVKQADLDKKYKENLELYITNTISGQEQFDAGFKEGVTYVISMMKTAVQKENINHIWKINHKDMNDLKFLANALLGSYAKRNTNG